MKKTTINFENLQDGADVTHIYTLAKDGIAFNDGVITHNSALAHSGAGFIKTHRWAQTPEIVMTFSSPQKYLRLFAGFLFDDDDNDNGQPVIGTLYAYGSHTTAAGLPTKYLLGSKTLELPRNAGCSTEFEIFLPHNEIVEAVLEVSSATYLKMHVLMDDITFGVNALPGGFSVSKLARDKWLPILIDFFGIAILPGGPDPRPDTFRILVAMLLANEVSRTLPSNRGREIRRHLLEAAGHQLKEQIGEANSR